MRNTLRQIKLIEGRSSRLSGLMQAALNLLRYEDESGSEPDFEALQALFDVIGDEVEALSKLSTEAATKIEELVNAQESRHE